jgi:hypothetical protein
LKRNITRLGGVRRRTHSYWRRIKGLVHEDKPLILYFVCSRKCCGQKMVWIVLHVASSLWKRTAVIGWNVQCVKRKSVGLSVVQDGGLV